MIDDQIEKLKSEISIAENALKQKVNDLDYTEIINDLSSKLLVKTGSKEASNPLISNVFSQWSKDYSYQLNVVRTILKILKLK